MVDLIIGALSIAVAIAWIPICVRFFMSWHKRGNPISLAICVLILFVMFVTVGNGVWVVLRHESMQVVTCTSLAVQAVVCSFFYASVHWSEKRFPDTRKQHEDGQ